MVKKVSIRLCLLLLALVFFVLGAEALLLAESENRIDTFDRITGNLTPYVSRDFKHIAELEGAKTEYKRRLEFASYQDERRKAGQKLLEVIETKVNLRPFEKDNWLELVRLQQVAEIHPSTRVFTAKTALFIGGWQSKYRANIGLMCIESPSVLLDYDNDFCQAELNYLRTPLAQKNLSLQGVAMKDLNNRLDQIEAQFCSDCEKK